LQAAASGPEPRSAAKSGRDPDPPAHNPEVAGSNRAPATGKGPGNGALSIMGPGLLGGELMRRDSAFQSSLLDVAASIAEDCVSN
jgi:hypothetical protein